jgi:hypothetical protein
VTSSYESENMKMSILSREEGRDRTYQVGVSGIQDGQKSDSEELTGRCAELDVTTLVVVDGGLGPNEPTRQYAFRSVRKG